MEEISVLLGISVLLCYTCPIGFRRSIIVSNILGESGWFNSTGNSLLSLLCQSHGTILKSAACFIKNYATYYPEKYNRL